MKWRFARAFGFAVPFVMPWIHKLMVENILLAFPDSGYATAHTAAVCLSLVGFLVVVIPLEVFE